jgi:hypothetical protein
MSNGYVGRDVLLEYSLQDPSVDVATLNFVRLGMMRSKELNMSWDTVDTTGDTSPNFLKSNLVTFKEVTISGDYVSQNPDTSNQGDFEDHVFSPPASTGNQPYVWFRITFGANGRVVTGNFLVNESNSSMPYSDAVTGSFSAMSNGEITSTRA